MSYLTIIQPEAELDLDEAFEYFRTQNSELAFDFLEAITKVLELLESNPFLFQKAKGEKRKVNIKRFNYSLIYKIKDKKVFILAIIHGKSNPRTWESRK
ncbi:MAG: type II toxin-antitoxin system RelE/ParE family toxin [Saprospiraceae bacterium]